MNKFKLSEYGMYRVASCSPDLIVADTDFNVDKIIEDIELCHKENVNLVVFPELSITGYSIGDLFLQNLILEESYKGINRILKKLETNYRDIMVVVGAPLSTDNQLFNCGYVLMNGKILGIVPKTHLPNYNEYYEKRWFSSSTMKKSKTVDILDFEDIPFDINLLFKDKNSGATIAVELCEDLWVPIPPSSYHCINGANIIVNLSSSNEIAGKDAYRRELISQQSARCITAYVYSSSNPNESTTDLVFSGHLLIAEDGTILKEREFDLSSEKRMIVQDIDIERLQHNRIKRNSFMENSQFYDYKTIKFKSYFADINKLYRDNINPKVFEPKDYKTIEKIINIQTAGLMKRMNHIGNKKLVIGISGGLDSTLALLICINTLKVLNLNPSNIITITMPGFGTTGRTYNNAVKLINELGTTFKEISIKEACLQHFEDIDHPDDQHDLTFENSQARERTQILMDVACKYNSIVVGTGNLSELALGWCTYNADHMSMYAVNCGIPKTLVKDMIAFIRDNMSALSDEAKETLSDILDTPISPELLPADKNDKILQKTENIIGEYIIHDFFLYYMMRHGFAPKKILFFAEIAFKDSFSKEDLKKWLKLFYVRFFNNQFKRSCLPDGPKVGSVTLSPRGDWRMPSDASHKMWTKEIDNL